MWWIAKLLFIPIWCSYLLGLYRWVVLCSAIPAMSVSSLAWDWPEHTDAKGMFNYMFSCSSETHHKIFPSYIKSQIKEFRWCHLQLFQSNSNLCMGRGRSNCENIWWGHIYISHLSPQKSAGYTWSRYTTFWIKRKAPPGGPGGGTLYFYMQVTSTNNFDNSDQCLC